MSEKTQSQFAKWIDLAFKATVVIGPILVSIMIMYLERKFVSRSEFERLAPRIDVIERTLLIMANQEKTLADHENRIRNLERSPRDGGSR